MSEKWCPISVQNVHHCKIEINEFLKPRKFNGYAKYKLFQVNIVNSLHRFIK